MEAHGELQVRDQPSMSLTPQEMAGQVSLIQSVMNQVMKKGDHWDVIPGTDKPALLKPGAEKLCLTFRLSPSYDVQTVHMDRGHREVIVTCTLTHISTGQVFGQGLGSCSTMESKYRWRKGEIVCPECGQSAVIKGAEQFGGGWLCWKKKGGCGKKWGDDKFSLDQLSRVENEDIADTYNTVLKMAKKRAQVDACLTAVGASDIFTQDIEEDAQPTQQPKANPGPPPAAQDTRSSTPPPSKGSGHVASTTAQQATAERTDPLSAAAQSIIEEGKIVANDGTEKLREFFKSQSEDRMRELSGHRDWIAVKRIAEEADKKRENAEAYASP